MSSRLSFIPAASSAPAARRVATRLRATSPLRQPFASPARAPRTASAFLGCVLAIAPVALASSSCAADESCDAPLASAGDTVMAATTLADLSGMKTIDGQDLAASDLVGKVVFAINVASACGLTNSGYATMRELGELFPDDLVVVAVPCNQFGQQESGTPAEIEAFARERVADLVITARTDVTGKKTHPIMALGKAAFPGEVMWNFDARFVFDRSGTPVARFDRNAGTDEIKAEIEKHL